MRVKKIIFAAPKDGYTLSGEALNFVDGGVIDQTVPHVNHTVTAPITGSPDVRIINNKGGTYKGLIFAPTSGSQVLGTAIVPYDDETQEGDKGGLTLGGTTTGNSVKEVRFEKGDRYANLNKEGTGTWTLGDVEVGTIRMKSGTLVLNGTVRVPYSGLVFTGGTLAGTATLHAPLAVPASGRLAPGGDAAGVMTVRGRLDLSAMAAGDGTLVLGLGAPGGDSDRVRVEGTADIGDGVLGAGDLDVSDLGGVAAGTYVLISTTEGITGTLDSDDRICTIGGLSGTLQIRNNNLEWATDSDGDGMPDDFELAHTTPKSATALEPDADLEHDGKGDGLKNLDEYLLDTDPTNPDSDGDSLEDGAEVAGAGQRPATDPADSDSDDDTLNDGVESNTGKWVGKSDTGTDPTVKDTDADGLADTVETNTGTFKDKTDTGTHPLKANTDGDNAGDWFEIYGSATDPNDAADKPAIPYPLPKPDFSRTSAKKPVKVFILSGQSNMVGFGRVQGDGPGTLETLVRDQKRFPNLIDKDGNWIANKNVMYRGVISDIGNGALSPLVAGSTFGPELGFGQIMDYRFEEPVLLIKSSIGNRSLSWDCLPPGSESFQADGYTYAGYGQSPDRWETGEEPDPMWWYAGKQYDDFFLDEADMGQQAWAQGKDYARGFQVRHGGKVYVCTADHTASAASEPEAGDDWADYWKVYTVFNVTDVLDSFKTEYPQWAEQGFEIAGFVWWQGHKDGGQQGTGPAGVSAKRYEKNLVNLIKSLREYYGKRYPQNTKPDAPFVVATVGFDGGDWEPESSAQVIHNAQMAVGNPAKHPEFKGTVASVDTTDYWRDAAESPTGTGYHYNHNAETYLLVGDALGRAMADLLENEADIEDQE